MDTYWQEIVDVGMPEVQTGRTGQEMYVVNLKGRSVDDYVFGVAPYDRNGYEGIVATYEPMARRR